MPTRTPAHTPALRTVLVCLPAHIHPDRLVTEASEELAAHGVHTRGVVPHFLPAPGRSPDLLSRALLSHQPHGTAGGPIGLLDLNRMRELAAAAATTVWQIWHDVVAGTRAAQPYWVYAQRHRDDPDRYPLDRVQQQYRAQPRIQAMSVYNALPHRPVDLPTSHLEAFQAGQHTYTTLAWLAAVPADGLATTPAAPTQRGRWLTPYTGALNHLLGYLRAANDHLATLPPHDNLVALAATT
jgi:hypothetical protein